MRLGDMDALRDLLQNLAYDDWNQGAPTTWAEAYGAVAELVADVPTIDAAPIRRGKWVVDEFGDTRCSECDGIATDLQAAIFGWCPYCGAKMEEE